MPEHKRQHYVPRCYLKPFSLDAAGAAINVFNIKGSRAIRNAPMKGQCAKDYIYGSDLVMERDLQKVEGAYAQLLRSLQGPNPSPTEADLKSLRAFAFLQYCRTDMAARRARAAEATMHRIIFEGRKARAPKLDLSDRAMMRGSMRLFARSYRYLDDLRVCIIRNNTGVDFVTSDDPSVIANRFHSQRLGENNFGVASSGILFFLPLTPSLMLMCYDGAVNTVPEKRDHYVSITKPGDALALNELQYLKAAENIFFARWDDRERVEREFRECQPRRPESWFGFFVGVPDKVVPGFGTRYRRATEHERATAREMIIGMSNLHPAPSRWLSKLKYRDPIRTHFDGSSVGHLRAAAWLRMRAERSRRRQLISDPRSRATPIADRAVTRDDA